MPLQAFSENRPSEPHSYWVEPSKSAEIGHELSNPGTLDVRVAGYVDGRPTGFRIDLKVIDPNTGVELRLKASRFDNLPGQEFERVTRGQMMIRIKQQIGS